jgi:tetratricopeptide (TPR) repeat protein
MCCSVFSKLTGFMLVIALLSPAHADDQTTCSNPRNADAAISACSRLISSGKLAGNALSEAYQWRGSAYIAKSLYDRALADFGESIRVDPRDYVSFTKRGLLYAVRGDYDSALQELNKAIQIQSNYALALSWRGSVFYQQGAYDQALVDLNKAIRFNPNDPMAYKFRGFVYEKQNELTKARDDLRRVLKLDSNDDPAASALKRVEEQLGKGANR